jgi:tetratricopeptide (TPR) repeat protein
LARKLLACAERDRALLQELEFEAALAGEADQVVFGRIAKALDQAMDVEEFVDWRGAGTLAEDLRAIVDQIGRVLEGGRASVALQLLDRFFESAEDLFEALDDSDGEVGGVFGEASELHLEAALAAKPDPIELADTLLDRELASDYGFWDGACATYAVVLGPAGVAEYRRLAEAAWASGDRELRGPLRRILDAFAKEAGDIDARIKLRAADATTGREHLEIAELYLDAGRKQEARKWLEDGLWKAEDRPEHGLERAAASLYRRLGEPGQAEAILWAAFERAPHFQLHLVLLEGAADARKVVDRGVALLSGKISAGERAHWSSPSTLMVEILRHAGRNDEAWAVVKQHGCAEAVLEQLVRASEETHPEQVIQTHARLIDAALAYANQSAYAGVVGRIARMERISARIGRLEAHGAYVQALALKHKAKRTFISLLNDRASWPRVKA